MYKAVLLTLIIMSLCGFGAKDLRPYELDPTHNPVYMPWDEFRSAIKLLPPRESQRHGKIYSYQSLLLVNEPNKGIHIIDNSDPTNPHKVAFINIPGNVDMVVKNDRLYVDSFTDLVVLSFDAIKQIEVINRRNNVFNYDAYQTVPPGQNVIGPLIDESAGVVIEWVPIKTEGED
jgi:hypothetical protein